MTRLMREIKDDVSFVRSHTLQPQWYKALKVLLVIGFVAGYWAWFGFARALVCLAVFLLLSLGVHLAYRAGTNKWRRTWLDFVVVETEAGPKPARIGKRYYAIVAFNALLAVLVSQVIPGLPR